MRTAVGYRIAGELLAAPQPSPSPGGGTCGGRVSIDVADGADAPGLAGFAHLANIVAAMALVGCALAVVGGILMATSGRFLDNRVGTAGRLAAFGGLLGAFALGLAAAAVNFAYNSGAESC